MKKVLSLVLAMALILAVAVPAFATETTLTDPAKAATGASTTVTATPKVPTINVVVPKTASVVVNPYQMSVGEGAAASQDQIISATSYITNKSDIKLNVGVSVTGKAGSGVTLASATAVSEKTNSVFLKFGINNSADNTSPLDFSTLPAANTVVVSATKQDITGLELAATTESAPNYLAFAVTGDAATAPDKPWTAAMTVTTTVAFTFTPVANTVAAGGGAGG